MSSEKSLVPSNKIYFERDDEVPQCLHLAFNFESCKDLIKSEISVNGNFCFTSLKGYLQI
jgi:hypothetical protein